MKFKILLSYFHAYIICFLKVAWNTHPPAGGFGCCENILMGISNDHLIR